MMKDSTINIAMILLFFIMVGMIIALILIPARKYHGPNSRNVLNKVHQENGKCYYYGIDLANCGKKLF